MTYGYDDVTTTSLGTAVAETQLNSGTSLSAPDPAHGFLACIPYQSESAAFTVDESLVEREIQSFTMIDPFIVLPPDQITEVQNSQYVPADISVVSFFPFTSAW